MIIVIDGPAGSGKSTTAKKLAESLGINFLDSGALYRAVTLAWLNSGKPDTDKFINNLTDLSIDAGEVDGKFTVWLNGKNVSEEIRTSRVADSVSEIASIPEVRNFVNKIMHKVVEKDNYIADGRDLGTAVFKDADLKFFMDATMEERARRRHNELLEKGTDITYDEVYQNLLKRDHTDSNRKADPLRKADDAIKIDTTGKTFDEQVSQMASIIKDRLKI